MASRQRFAMTTEAVLGIAAGMLAAVVVGAVWGGAALAGLVGLGVAPPHNPLRLLVELVRHRYPWSGWDTYYAVVVAHGDGRCRGHRLGAVVGPRPAPPHRPPRQAAPPRPGWPCAATRTPTPDRRSRGPTARSSAPTSSAGGWCGRRGRTWPWWWPEPGCERPPPG